MKAIRKTIISLEMNDDERDAIVRYSYGMRTPEGDMLLGEELTRVLAEGFGANDIDVVARGLCAKVSAKGQQFSEADSDEVFEEIRWYLDTLARMW